MSYKSTAIQLLAAGTQYDGQFLKTGLSEDALAKPIAGQGDASLFNVPNTVYGFISGFATTGGPYGERQASVDLVSHMVPILFTSTSRLADEPYNEALGCNTFSTNNGGKNRARCSITASNAPYQFGTGWAICNNLGYGQGALWMYDSDFFNNTTPTGCTDVDLLVVAAPA